MTESIRMWLRAHVSRAAVIVYAVGVLLEIFVGNSPLTLPGMGEGQYLWGLVLPLLTIAAVCVCLDSGVWWLETAVRRRWRVQRFLWVAAASVLAVLPALWAQDGLSVDGSVRNRVLLVAFALLALRVIPGELAVVPSAVLMLLAMLMGGAGASTSPLVAVFLREGASPGQLVLASGLWLVGALAYAVLHPTTHHRAPAGETVS